ncbi:single-stranded DNA-binding protein [Sporosarcina sp. P18a]|nr:single-stranded DNA-binding protein [Sporosarcina sp. P18a]PIC81054.1 single-stranded DNA-binding protein [Sporosarcina sp. P18a]
MINRVVLVGRLTKDPELKVLQSGIHVCRFTLAVNRPFKSEGGEQQADFIQCVAWRKQAENVANYLKKGSLAGVDGRITTGSFEEQDGKRVFTVEVTADSTQFLEPKSNRSEQPNTSQNAPQQSNRQGHTNNSIELSDRAR